MKYYIVGYTYSGKTTFGRRLAAEQGLDFADLDWLFEQRYHYTVTDFFRRFGESAFRKIETQLLQSTTELNNIVIATGGGTPCHSGNMDFILANGKAIYLQMNVEQLVQRALRSHRPRPSMRGLSEDEIRAKITIQLNQREPYYLRAHTVLDGTDPHLLP